MSEKIQTAVDWLFDNLNICFDKFDNGEYSYTEFVNASNEIKEQAKAMHMEEIIKARLSLDRSNMSDFPKSFNNATDYYYETFKSE